ncbi:sigma-70 family RNA polymerase sigma factor [Roseateles asaccharophilus]|uniref:RNA polymerase sigma-70 factor (ECF subfamily) n=1 Tax=Roseateles asaccharophilus TaxID=582607 RepID=A0ABU2A7H1_9BURK|nr:sigma-70 family RNA polymerase sigma factor [Roseateles asaccharophilus]MDR7333142.1 RNA polymerase sigma-70 factor (ECF subfamily) [Roseateles asaccharophilus]
MTASNPQDQLYRQAIAAHGAELARCCAGYERDAALRQELQQELHLALWQSLAGFRGDCSLRTWVYRVAHNVGARHVQQHAGKSTKMLELDEIEHLPDERLDPGHTERRLDLQRVLALVHRLAPLDRELMLLYLEELDAASIADITGLSARNVATKIHRIKALLASQLSAPRSAR